MNVLYKIIFAVIYTFGYFFLAIMATGGGHGNFLFAAPFFTWIFVLIALFLTGKADNLSVRIIFVALLLLHYVHIFVYLKPLFFGEIDPVTVKFWRQSPLSNLFVALWYFAGQIVIWALFFKNIKSRKILL